MRQAEEEKTQHPGERSLERFLRGESPREEANAVVRHLLAGCPRCVQVTGQVWGFANRKPLSPGRVPSRQAPVAAGALGRRA